MKTYYTWTIGCQMNKADTERLESGLEQLGLSSTPSPRDADVIVVNSCVVRQSAEDKAAAMLSTLKGVKRRNPEAVVALMGCMVGPEADSLRQRFPHVDAFMRPQQYEPLFELLGRRMEVDIEGCLGQLTASTPAVTTYVPVIHGCDKFCSFCIIPYRRGRQVSRPVEEVVQEVEHLAARGVKEVTLLGQTVDAYGYDLPGRPGLADLLKAVHQVEGLSRIRFLTSHPNDMSDRIIEAVAELEKVCEHINLPFQAGDDAILDSMRRGYTSDQYRRLVERIRMRMPNVSMSTDVIVGFCGETEAQFQSTVDMITDLRFDKVHLAAYSTRQGTIADRKMADDVPDEEKKRRLRVLEALQERIATEINAPLQGQTLEVLVDGHKNGKGVGRTRSDKLVFFENGSTKLGDLVVIRTEKTSPWSLQGSLVT